MPTDRGGWERLQSCRDRGKNLEKERLVRTSVRNDGKGLRQRQLRGSTGDHRRVCQYNLGRRTRRGYGHENGDVIKIRKDDVLHSSGNFSDDGKEAFYALYHLNREVLDYCTAYEKSSELKADGLSEKYRCLAEFNGTVLAAKYNEEYGFEFVTWDRTYDGKAVCQGKYFEDYAAAKENFATRSGLIDKDKLFTTEELERIGKCVDFTMRHNGDLNFDDCECLKKLNEKILESLPEQQQSGSPEMSM